METAKAMALRPLLSSRRTHGPQRLQRHPPRSTRPSGSRRKEIPQRAADSPDPDGYPCPGGRYPPTTAPQRAPQRARESAERGRMSAVSAWRIPDRAMTRPSRGRDLRLVLFASVAIVLLEQDEGEPP